MVLLEGPTHSNAGLKLILFFSLMNLIPSAMLGSDSVTKSLFEGGLILGFCSFAHVIAKKLATSFPVGPIMFFADFQLQNGLALSIASDTYLFLWQIISEPHNALDNFFIFPIGIHLASVLFFIPFALYKLLARHFSITDRNELFAFGFSIITAYPFFYSLRKTWFHRLVSAVIGGTYLCYFYLTIIVFLTPSWVATVPVTVESAVLVKMAHFSKYSQSVNTYCQINGIHNSKKMSLRFDNCPSCAEIVGTTILATHHVLDYNSLRANKADCK